MQRTTEDVFKDHLRLRMEGKIEEDIKQNYAENVVLLSSVTRFFGKDGVRKSAQELQKDIGKARFEYVKQDVEGDFAYLVWKAFSPDRKACHGADSFLIREGKILVQSIYYTVEAK